jgi:Protein of unknown function (DUF1573)
MWNTPIHWMRTALLWVCIVCPFLLGFQIVFHGGGRAPKIMLPDSPLDLGTGEPGQDITGTFQIRNSGSRTLTFSLNPSCGCSHVSPISGTIAPHQSQPISIGVRVDASGERKLVNIAIDSNDPSSPRHSFQVFAGSTLPLIIRPKFIDFGSILPGVARRIIMTIRDNEGRDISSDSDVKISSNSKFIETVGP